MDQPLDRIDPRRLQGIFSKHLGMYRSKIPYYQAEMLNSLLRVWKGRHDTLIDVGGGTGIIAQAVSEIFAVDKVCVVDVVDRFCENLTVHTQCYDGKNLPFADREFDAAMLNNVLHHVPVQNRVPLLREIRKKVRGPLYIKDHESCGAIDNLRLQFLDAVGNIPFGGMIWARYIERSEWTELALQSGYRIEARVDGNFRTAPYSLIFPNRLEVTMRFEPVTSDL